MGDSVKVLESAITRIASLPQTKVVKRASLYETEAVDVPERYKDIIFLNTVVIIETALTPDELSASIHKIEEDLGRVRTGERHEPRIIDIDIITCDEVQSDRKDLTLPHPEAIRRRFVIEPLAEIAPDYIIPNQSLTAKELLATIPEKPSCSRIS